jgi:xanthine dehydrogenase accessory factor
VELIEAEQRGAIAEFARREAEGWLTTRGHLSPEHGVMREISDSALTPGAAAYAGGVLTEGFGDDRRPLILFGAGHVGRALVLALVPLPFAVTWVDPRPDAFPAHVPANVTLKELGDPADALAAAPNGAFVLVMSHSHQLDLALVSAALADARFPYVGLIGSKSKRARFEKRLAAGGIPAGRIAELVCPIGVGGIRSKAPAVIAAATATELLIRDEALRAATVPAADTRRSRTAR